VKIWAIETTSFRLDGGGIFGVVPKTAWSKRVEADDRNRVRLTSRVLLIESDDARILIDAGLGNGYDEPFLDRFAIDPNGPTIADRLGQLNVDPGDVTQVVQTHLHFDHCDGLTRQTAGGEFVPTFPNARHLVQRRQWDWALSRNIRDRASYRAVSYQPIAEAGLLDLTDGECRPFDWMRLIVVEGHTAAMQLPLIETPTGERVFFPSDLVPTACHVAIPWVMGFDLRPMDTMREKAQWLREAAQHHWTLVLQHDANDAIGRVTEEDHRFKWVAEGGQGVEMVPL
jgi:glyoxylase-like metal-dependent hydrolase (beta-lactamase superfamily II)